MTYYREATVHTQELLDLLVKCENKIQTVRSMCTLLCSCHTAHGPLFNRRCESVKLYHNVHVLMSFWPCGAAYQDWAEF